MHLEPYLHKKYNVRAFFNENNFSTENALAKIYNALVKVINENSRLPRAIVILPGTEFFKSINHVDYGVSLMIGKCIDWLILNIERMIHTRKLDLQQKGLGAVDQFEPKIIWLKMLNAGDKAKLPLVAKFNAILEQSLLRAGSGFVMDLMPFHRMHWDRNGMLTHDGRIEYWRHVSRVVNGFDHQEEGFDLLPKNNFHSSEHGRTTNRGPEQAREQMHRY